MDNSCIFAKSGVVFLGINNNIYTNFSINILENHERRFRAD